jgi:hypothetical protein
MATRFSCKIWVHGVGVRIQGYSIACYGKVPGLAAEVGNCYSITFDLGIVVLIAFSRSDSDLQAGFGYSHKRARGSKVTEVSTSPLGQLYEA